MRVVSVYVSGVCESVIGRCACVRARLRARARVCTFMNAASHAHFLTPAPHTAAQLIHVESLSSECDEAALHVRVH